MKNGSAHRSYGILDSSSSFHIFHCYIFQLHSVAILVCHYFSRFFSSMVVAADLFSSSSPALSYETLSCYFLCVYAEKCSSRFAVCKLCEHPWYCMHFVWIFGQFSVKLIYSTSGFFSRRNWNDIPLDWIFYKMYEDIVCIRCDTHPHIRVSSAFCCLCTTNKPN